MVGCLRVVSVVREQRRDRLLIVGCVGASERRSSWVSLVGCLSNPGGVEMHLIGPRGV